MKVLIAVDGSPCSTVAVDLAASLDWPAGSTLHLVSALDSVRLAGPWAGLAPVDLSTVESALLVDVDALLGRLAERLASTGCAVVPHALIGRAPDSILEEAAEIRPDLLILGSRGFGPMRSLLLGSVSAEVVDHATCPVLIARSRTVSRVMLAQDGSLRARNAEDALADLHLFDALPVEVLSVARFHSVMPEPVAPGAQAGSIEAYHQAIGDTRQRYEEIGRSSAERLQRLGWDASWDVRGGDPAHVIVTEAENRGVDLVVMGTHGRTGVNRVVLGSVAHKILTHAHCSVLVVRGPVPAHADEPHRPLPARVGV